MEALNALFDVYADKDFDYDEQVFVRFGFLDHLKGILPKVKAMVSLSVCVCMGVGGWGELC